MLHVMALRRLVPYVVLGLAVSLLGSAYAAPRPEAVAARIVAALDDDTLLLGGTAVVAGHVEPRRRRTVQVQVQVRKGGSWATVVQRTTTPRGTFRKALPPSVTDAAGTVRLRVRAPRSGRLTAVVSPGFTLRVSQPIDPSDCAPAVAPVDPQVDASARCLAAQLDAWEVEDRMPIGQQLNVSAAPGAVTDPLDELPVRPKVVGFDLQEVIDARGFGNDPVPLLIDLAQDGAVLTASWHANNPHPGADDGPWDRSWTSIAELLEPGTTDYDTFWDWYDDGILPILAELAEAGVAVIFRPLHEANGSHFWWGAPDHDAPAADTQVWRAKYGELFARLQQHAWDAGVHNLLWHYSVVPDTWEGTDTAVGALPDAVDMAGLSAYDPDHTAAERAVDQILGSGHDVAQDALAAYGQLGAAVARVALAETGPQGSTGAWPAKVVETDVEAAGITPAYALFWFDDGDGTGGEFDITGRKQIGSLVGGKTWIATCPDGTCGLG